MVKIVAHKDKELTSVAWLTMVSHWPYENINSFWVACQERLVLPEGCYLLHTPELTGHAASIKCAMEAIYSQYFPREKPPGFILKEFNEEDIPSFIKTINEIFLLEKKIKRRLALDITPTTWSFIPSSLVLLAREHQEVVAHIFYHQYAELIYHQRPYALIPRKANILHDLLQDAHLGEYIIDEEWRGEQIRH